ncbi:YadA family autotransporter adhesin [Burkholderia cepacia]|uniref:YadA family autotransporter adhesin n=1 Tax=Burkholderia cepacia TaxID=292 RepID=UPI003855F2A9
MSTGLSSTNSTVAGLSTGLSSTTSTVASHTTQIGDLDDKLSKLESGTSGLVQQVNPGDDITVGANTDGNAVNFSSKTGARKLAGVAAGDVSATSTEAVNGSQLHGVSDSVASAIGGNSKVNPDGSISAPSFTVGDGSGGTKIVNSVGDVVTNLDGRTTTNEGDIKKLADDIGSGTLGLVQQANPGDDITVGANTDGNAVNFSSKTGARKLAGVAAGDVSATSTEAVNGSQLHGVSDSVASAIGGNSKVNSDGSISAPSFTVGDGGGGGTKIVNSVGDVVTNLDGRTTTNEGDIKKLADDIGSGTLGLVQQANPGDDITVGANTDGNTVNFSSKTGARKLAGVAAGDVSATSTEAVNGSQLHGVSDSVASAIGGGTTVNPDGSISAPSFTVGDGSGGTKIVNSVGDVVTNLDGRVTTNEGDIKKLADDIGSGTLGLVQQANPGDDITVGANTDGNAVNFSSKTGARKLAGVAAGDVSATSTEAVNGSQLHGVSDSVAAAIGGNSKVNSDGSISAPSFTVGDGSGGTKIVNSVGDVVTNLDGRTTTNEGDIKKLADDIGSGTLGLVQQANPGDDITVGANTDGNAVNFSSKTGARKLAGVAAGDVSATSTEAVNGSQLHGVSDSVASAIGGNSKVNSDGSISAPSFTVGDGSGGTKIVNSVGDAVTNLDGRMTTNEGGLKKLSEQFESGTLGLVQQNPTTGGITVGANTGGSVVNFAGAGGALRTLTGVANGVEEDDVVTVSQLRATGLIDYTGKEVGAVTYDLGLSFDTVTFAGSNGTLLSNVKAGVADMDAVNVSQLNALQQQFADQYARLDGQFGDLSNRFDDLSDRLGELETNPGTGGPGTGGGSTVVGEGAVASGENSSAIGDSALASGENSSAVGQGAVASGSNSSAIGQGSTASGSNSSAVGQGAVASGNNGSAIGQGSVASGENGTALGQGAVASGKDTTALGQGASATGSGSVAIGQGSVATEANTVSFGDGTAEGNRRLVNIADGINASDAATKGQLDRAMESVDQRFNDTNRAINDVAKNAYAGIAAAMAMPNMTPSQPGKTVVAVGAANFKSGSAIAAGATYRSRNGSWLVNGATSITSVGDVGVRAQVGYEF